MLLLIKHNNPDQSSSAAVAAVLADMLTAASGGTRWSVELQMASGDKLGATAVLVGLLATLTVENL